MSTPTRRAVTGGRLWIAGVVAILGATVGVNLYVLRIASADPSFAVEPDYYGKALRWDDELAQRDHNAALGWRVEPALATTPPAGATLNLRLADAGGRPVRDASVRVRAFAVARAAHVVEATLAAASDGGYSAALPVNRAGLWELRVEAVRGRDRFTSVHRLDVRAGAEAQRR